LHTGARALGRQRFVADAIRLDAFPDFHSLILILFNRQ